MLKSYVPAFIIDAPIMMAKPIRKLSTGLSSWGRLVLGSLLGRAVSDDIADVVEVVTLVELIQVLIRRGKTSRCETLYHHLAENTALGFKQFYWVLIQ